MEEGKETLQFTCAGVQLWSFLCIYDGLCWKIYILNHFLQNLSVKCFNKTLHVIDHQTETRDYQEDIEN